ncbi:hypothetical protein ACCS78_40875, partial [Rhizobium johnstonii]
LTGGGPSNSTPTVSAITASLLDDGLILPRHEGDIRNEAVRGRPRVMLELNPDAARVVGAKIAANRMVFVVTNFRAVWWPPPRKVSG